MRRNLLSILTAFIFLGSIAIAQPILTATGINPVVGDAFAIENYSSGFSPGNSGANQNWNIVPAGTTTLSIMDTYNPSSTPNGSYFLAADVCLTDGSGFYDYYKTSSLTLRHYGTSSSAAIIPYNDPAEILRFPLSMGNTYSDTWLRTQQNTGATTTGTTTITYDGYGTVTLPSGTYNNVVRVHSVEDAVFQSGSTTINYSTDSYLWYINGSHQPIASTYTVAAFNVEGSTILTNIATNVNEQDELSSYISSYPNPAANELNFELNNTINVKEIEILDIAGKIVYNNQISQSMMDNVLKVNTSDFKDGIYFAKFKLEDGETVTKKVSILK